MSRTLHADVAAAAISPALQLAFLAEFAFPAPGTVLRTTTAPRDIVYASNTYLANTLLQRFGGVTENSDFKPRRVAFTLPGSFTAAFNSVKDDNYQFALVHLYLCVINSDTYALVGDPVALATDLMMSTAVIASSKDSFVIELSTEGPEVLAGRDSANLASHVAQLRRYAGDTGMLNVEKIPTFELTWGGMPQGVGAGPASAYLPGRSGGASGGSDGNRLV